MKKCKVCNREDAVTMFSTRAGDGYQVVCLSSACVIGPHRPSIEEAEKAWDDLMDTSYNAPQHERNPIAGFAASMYGNFRIMVPYTICDDGTTWYWHPDRCEWLNLLPVPGTKEDR